MQPPADEGNEDGLPQTHDHGDGADETMDLPLSEYMQSKYQLPPSLCHSLASLALSLDSAETTSARDACDGIRRHLSSMGLFGPGFSAVLPKWGGPSEISQVGCRACAVGGGVYALERGIAKIDRPTTGGENKDSYLNVHLSDETVLQAKHVVGSHFDIPNCASASPSPKLVKAARSITIVGSPLHSLFPPVTENGHIPGATMIFISGEPPLYLVVHSSDTGECPVGQSTFIFPLNLLSPLNLPSLVQASYMG